MLLIVPMLDLVCRLEVLESNAVISGATCSDICIPVLACRVLDTDLAKTLQSTRTERAAIVPNSYYHRPPDAATTQVELHMAAPLK